MEKLRLGLVGCGKMMSAHVKGVKYVDNVDIVAGCDILPDNARETAEELGELVGLTPKIYTNRRDMDNGKHTQYEIKHFAECVMENKQPDTHGRNALHSLRVIWALYDAEHHNEMADLRKRIKTICANLLIPLFSLTM